MSDKKTVIKRRKFNFLKFLIFIIIVVSILYVFTNLVKKPIKNIIVLGNSYLTDEMIIETAKIENYPSFIKTSSSKVCNRLKNIELVKSCNVNKKWGYIIKINIEEYKILYKKRNTNEYILENGKSISYDNLIGIPLLINYVSDEISNKFNEELSLVSTDIINKISEIEYSPTDYDSGRFILYMNDENMVYITLTKVENLNKYDEIKKELEGKKGILYLDSGNYFEIKE